MKTLSKMRAPKKSWLKRFLIIFLPAIVTFGFNCLVYFITKFLILPERFIYPDMAIDRLIPFIPQFVIIYYLSFAQWVNYYIQASLGDLKRCDRYFSAYILAKIICFFIFIIWPIAMRWPVLPENGNIWTKILAFTYGVDSPARAFPSLHCFYSWIAFRYSLESEPANRRWISVLQLLFSLAVFATTMLIKQHYFIDVIGGIALAEICLQIAGHTGLPELFGRLMDKLNRVLSL